MIYEYRCATCKEIKEVDIPMADDNPKKLKCPKCGTMTMKKVFDLSPSVVIPERFTKILTY